MENWSKVKGFDLYSISDYGNIRNDKSGRILKQRVSTGGYACLIIVKNKKHYLRYIHRLVGEAFLPNPNNLPQIDHIDGNKLNNAVNNLRWVTVSENRTAYGNEQRAINRMRAVVAKNDDGREITFPSRTAVGDYFKCSDSKVKYNYRYSKGTKKGWIFYKVEDIV